MRVDPNGDTEPQEELPPGGEARADEHGGHWSPWSTRAARWSWGLMAIFTTIYFVVAILTSAEFADLAATMVLGLPLGFWLGIGLIISGLIITRIYLTKVEG